MATALKPLHPKLRGVEDEVPFFLDDRTLRNTANLTLITDWGALDVLSDVAGVKSFDDLWSRSILVDVESYLIRIANLDDLIAMKRAANRLKDQNHILELEALRKLKAQV